MSQRGLRDSLASIVPEWLSNRPGLNVGYRILYSFATQYDTLIELARQGVRAWMPGLSLGDASPTVDASSALPYIGASRGLVQGFAESAASFANRAVLWIDLWRMAARPGGVIANLLGYCLPTLPLVLQVDNGGNWYFYGPGQDIFSQPIPAPTFDPAPGLWVWDSLSQPYRASYAWWRVWYIIFSDPNIPNAAPFAAPSATWDGGARWDDGTCWDWAGTSQQAQTLLGILKTWKRAKVSAELLISYENTPGVPPSHGDAIYPKGLWGRWGKVVADGTRGRVMRPARPAGTVVSFLGKVN